jgi:hypothetical protein
MRRLQGFLRLRVLFALILAVAMGPGTGVHHRSAALETMLLAAYAMPDGTLPVICGEMGSGSGDHAEHCPDCLQTVAPALVVARMLPLRAAAARRCGWPEALVATAGLAGPPPSARGPPAAFT